MKNYYNIMHHEFTDITLKWDSGTNFVKEFAKIREYRYVNLTINIDNSEGPINIEDSMETKLYIPDTVFATIYGNGIRYNVTGEVVTHTVNVIPPGNGELSITSYTTGAFIYGYGGLKVYDVYFNDSRVDNTNDLYSGKMIFMLHGNYNNPSIQKYQSMATVDYINEFNICLFSNIDYDNCKYGVVANAAGSVGITFTDCSFSNIFANNNTQRGILCANKYSGIRVEYCYFRNINMVEGQKGCILSLVDLNGGHVINSTFKDIFCEMGLDNQYDLNSSPRGIILNNEMYDYYNYNNTNCRFEGNTVEYETQLIMPLVVTGSADPMQINNNTITGKIYTKFSAKGWLVRVPNVYTFDSFKNNIVNITVSGSSLSDSWEDAVYDTEGELDPIDCELNIITE